MSINPKVYFEDILESIQKILQYTKGLTRYEFASQEKIMVVDATIRNLEIIGEAIKNVPDEIKKENSDVEWRKIAGLRNILIHEYFDVDIEIIWDVIENKLPGLQDQIKKVLINLKY